jgi:sulfatase modifying factor 1
VIVGLAGHGVLMLATPHDEPKGEPRPRSFFCPMDANLARKSLEKFVSFDELYAGLAASKATTKLLLVDACRNELLANPQGRSGGIAMPPPPLPPDSVAALFSCSEKEVSWEDAELNGGHGVFFHYVIEGLKGQADVDSDRKVSLLELTEYAQKNVSAFVRRKHAVSQLPRLRGDIGPVALLDVTARPSNPRSFTNSIGVKLTLINAGEFMMGSDATDPDGEDDEFVDKAAGRKVKHRVRITKPFYLGIHEVTRGQFRRFVDGAGYQTKAEKNGKGGYGWNEEMKKFEQNPHYTWHNAGFDQTDEHPVVNVSWKNAQEFVTWLSRTEGKTYRLPTEAEWENACPAGSTTRFSFGDDPEGLAAVGNVADGTARAKYPDWAWGIAAQDRYVYTAPVGVYKPNAWGLYDMHGNVCEWCSDGFAADYYKQSPVDDPPGVLGASHRVYRGGGWNPFPRVARSALRDGDSPGDRYVDLGFRLALVQSSR